MTVMDMLDEMKPDETLGQAAARFKSERDALRAEINEYSRTLDRQNELLTGVVNAIKGEPPKLVAWSHHDAPKLAAALRAEVNRLKGGAEPVAEVIDNKVGVFIAWTKPPSSGRPPAGTKLYTHPPQPVPDNANEIMLSEGVESLRTGLDSFPDNYTQIVSNIWEDMYAAAAPQEPDQ